MNTEQEEIKKTIEEIFRKILAKLREEESPYRGRELYYIAKYCLRIFKYCPIEVSGKNPPFSTLFNVSFYYFLQKSRLEDAEEVYRLGFRNMTPRELIVNYFKAYENSKKAEKPLSKFELSINIDNMISFLAQLGYEKEIQESNFIDSDCLELKRLVDYSWVNLLKNFLGCRTISHCCRFLKQLFTSTNKSSIDKRDIDEETAVKFSKWLLKRQVLAIYAAIMVDYFSSGFFHSPEELNTTLKEIEKWVGGSYINYLTLLCYHLEQEVKSVESVLSNIKGSSIDYEELLDNFIDRIGKISSRYSDLKEMFESLMGLKIEFDWAKIIKDFFEKGIKKHLQEIKSKKTSIDQFINWLKQAVDYVERENRAFLKGEMVKKNINIISYKILNNGDDSFWQACRQRFNPERLRVLAASIDNKYSTESTYFFNTPTIKLDREKPISTELHVLKKWGSSAGIFERDKRHHANFGGGYFIYHHGFGLAIDPGPDFIRNLTQHTDFDLVDINGVVCTHIHYDHFGDFIRVILGIREYKENVGKKHLYYLLPDRDDQMMHPKKLREGFCIKVFKGFFNPGKKKQYYLPNNSWGKENGFCIQPLKVTHKIYAGRTRSYGLLVMPLQNGKPVSRILFSGDALYEKDLFKKVNPEPEILVLNLSSVRLGDISALTGLNSGSDSFVLSNGIKKNHLGYSGVLSLLRRFQHYRLAIINDFYEPQSEIDSSLMIREALEKDCCGKKNPGKKILAGEIGMRLRCNDQRKWEIYCTPMCGDNEGFIIPNVKSGLDQVKRSIFSRKESNELSCSECTETKKKFGYRA